MIVLLLSIDPAIISLRKPSYILLFTPTFLLALHEHVYRIRTSIHFLLISFLSRNIIMCVTARATELDHVLLLNCNAPSFKPPSRLVFCTYFRATWTRQRGAISLLSMALSTSPRKVVPLAAGDDRHPISKHKSTGPAFTKRVFYCGVVVENSENGRRLPQGAFPVINLDKIRAILFDRCSRSYYLTWRASGLRAFR